MPQTIKSRRPKIKKSETIGMPDTFSSSFKETGKTKIFSKKHIIIILILLIALLIWKFKSYFIVAFVNGQPISRWQLNEQLAQRFGEQALDNIISERLILAAARQKGIFITKEEIDGRINQIKQQITGGVDLSQALKAQGLTENDFRRQIEIQLSIDKMFDKEASVSTQDVEDYISKNTSLLKTSTNPAMLREEVKGMLKQQKTGELFTNWFDEIRKKADIKKFL